MSVFRYAFLLAFISLFALAHRYAWARLARDTTQHRRTQRISAWVATAVGVLTIAFFVLSRVFHTTAGALLGSVWMGLLLNLLMALLVLDLVRVLAHRVRPTAAPVSPARREVLSRAIAGTGLVLAGGVTGFGAFRAYAPARVTEVPIRLPGWPRALDGFSIVQLTDIHIGSLLRERFFDDLVDRAMGAKGDLIALTGDLVDGSVPQLGRIVSRVSRLHARYGTHFVTGNHDYYSGAEEWVAVLEGLGINVLRNRSVKLGDAGASFRLAGVDDWGMGRTSSDYDLHAALQQRQPDEPVILLAHQPANFDAVAKEKVALQISGHTHGGQMFPATLIADLIYGKRNVGLSQTEGSQLFVSRGCGFVGPPARDGSPPEIVKLVLMPA